MPRRQDRNNKRYNQQRYKNRQPKEGNDGQQQPNATPNNQAQLKPQAPQE